MAKPSYLRYVIMTCCLAGFVIVASFILNHSFIDNPIVTGPLQTNSPEYSAAGTTAVPTSLPTIDPTQGGVNLINERVSYQQACNMLGFVINPAAANQGFKEYIITADRTTQVPSKLTYVYETGEVQLILQGKVELGDDAINYKSREYYNKTILVQSGSAEISMLYENDSISYFAVFNDISESEVLSIFCSVI